MTDYQICTQCVMDTTMPGTMFDEDGLCNNCIEVAEKAERHWFPNEKGKEKFAAMVSRIKKLGEGKEYDCLFGLSGGVDSSFLALKLEEWGLRPLVVHIDAGWNEELAVANIQTIIDHCNYDLVTQVVDWEIMKDLQYAYFKSGVYNQDVPQDHVFIGSLFKHAAKHNIKSVISGHNYATESVPMRWQHQAMDAINLKAIYKKFGRKKLKIYETISFFDVFLTTPLFRKTKFYWPLNYMPYSKEMAIKELETIGWKNYGRKHGESSFTKFFQEYYLPTKFGIDKRRPHLSSLILAKQMSRETALAELEKPVYDKTQIEFDIDYFCKKIDITRKEFDETMESTPSLHTDFKNWNGLMKLFAPFKKIALALRS